MLALKNLLRRKLRSFLSLMGIAIGVAAIVAFNAISQGFKYALDQYLNESGAQMLVVNKTVQDPSFSRVKKEEYEFVQAQRGVTHVSLTTFSLASPRGLKVTSFSMPAMPVYGRTPGDRMLDKFKARVKGRVLERDDEIMLGSITAENLKLVPGDLMEFFNRTFRVVGVYDSGVSFERIGAIVANSVIQQQLGMADASSVVFVYLRTGTDWKDIKRAVEERYSHLAAFRSDEFTVFYNQLDYIDWFVWIISLVSVMVGGLGVLNTMLMSVSERTREIGMLRAVGWSRRRVLGLILSEGTTISVGGGLVGLLAGWTGAEVLIHWAPRDFLSARYSPELFGMALLVAVGLGFIGALYPAWRASRLSPMEALRFE